jgi:hypothetical protein
MKHNILLIFLPIIFACFSVSAQITATSDGKVTNTNQTKPKAEIDIATIDFKNFTFPDLFTGKTVKTFTLKNGQYRNGKQSSERVFTLRKTYYFDITGDAKNEAITQIFAESCNINCESQSLFYVHTIVNNQPKLIWKIATGTNELCGLKSVSFKIKEIALESFGECAAEMDLIKPSVDSKKPNNNAANFTRFTFLLKDGVFAATTKDISPLQEKFSVEYRPKIRFGEQ